MTAPLVFGAIADDLTGALELASLIRRGGVRCPVLLRPGARAPSTGWRRWSSASRPGSSPPSAPSRPSPARSMPWSSGACARVFYKYCATFDSTPRGNIGPCADLLAQRRAAGFTLFSPAFPEVNRTVYQGHLFAGDILISNSPKRFDPLTPMREPNLVKVLQQQTATRVGLLPHSILAQGAAATVRHAAKLEAEGIGYAIADALDEADLQVTAEASVDWPLMTGGSSVAVYYPELWRGRGWLTGRDAGVPGAAGPCPVGRRWCWPGAAPSAPSTSWRISAGSVRCCFWIPAGRWTAAGGRGAGGRGPGLRRAELARGPAAIATSARPEEVAKLQRRLGRRRAAHLAEKILARIATGLYAPGYPALRRFRRRDLRRVLEALEVEALEVDSYVTAGQSIR